MFERFTERAARWSRWSRKRPGVSGKITQARSTCCWTCCAKKGAAQALRAFGAALDELCGQVEGIAARVLSNLDVDPDAVRHEVVRGLSDAGREADSRTESIPC
jgi:hypothetical protein